jgi:hypothetical protein
VRRHPIDENRGDALIFTGVGSLFTAIAAVLLEYPTFTTIFAFFGPFALAVALRDAREGDKPCVGLRRRGCLILTGMSLSIIGYSGSLLLLQSFHPIILSLSEGVIARAAKIPHADCRRAALITQ